MQPEQDRHRQYGTQWHFRVFRATWATGLCAVVCGCSTTTVVWSDLGSAQILSSTGTVLAANQYAQAGVVSDGQNVYWINSSGSIHSTPLAGGTITTLGSTWGDVVALVFDRSSQSLFWANNNGVISSMATSGGSISQLTSAIAPASIAVDSVNLYWTDAGGGRVWQCQKNNCLATMIVVWSQPLSNTPAVPWGIAVDASNIYFTDNTGRTINQLPIGGGHTTVLADSSNGGFPNPAAIVVDSSYVYWVNAPGGALHKVPINGGTVTELIASSSVPTNASCGDSCTTMSIVTDGTNLYWADYSGNQINMVANNCAAPCTPTNLAMGNGPISLSAVVTISGLPP